MLTIQKEKIRSIDSFGPKYKKEANFDWPLADFVMKHKNASVLFYKYGRKEKFLTQYADLYLDQERNKDAISMGSRIDSIFVQNRIFFRPSRLEYGKIVTDTIYENIKERYDNLGNYFSDLARNSVRGVSMVRMWNVSIVCSLIFGMFLMTFIYRYLGQGAAAEKKEIAAIQNAPQVAGVMDTNEKKDEAADVTEKLLTELDKQDKEKQGKMEEKMRKMVEGYPIEKMIPYILKKDKIVAAFIIGIAKQESNWGKRVPVDDEGNDCYNYWGYRGKKATGTGGHSCFSSPKEAVDTIAKRLDFLVSKEDVNTPKEMMVVWKCGYDCSWDKPENGRRWIEAVDTYFKKLN